MTSDTVLWGLFDILGFGLLHWDIGFFVWEFLGHALVKNRNSLFVVLTVVYCLSFYMNFYIRTMPTVINMLGIIRMRITAFPHGSMLGHVDGC